MKKVFLGGTCNNSTWRNQLIALLNAQVVDFFNPVVEDWTPECQAEEVRQRETCDFCLYVLTPKMTGVYSIAEVVEDSLKRPGKTLFAVLENDDDAVFSPAQVKSLGQVGRMVLANGAAYFSSLEAVAQFLNVDGKTVGGVSVPAVPQLQRVLIDALVYPSAEKTIVCLPTDEKFAGAHNYDIKPMLRYEDGAVYGLEGMPLTFVKRNEDGTWQPGVQSEQLLQVLIDRHAKLNAVFPTDVHDEFVVHLAGALECLERRVRERTERGVMGQSVK